MSLVAPTLAVTEVLLVAFALLAGGQTVLVVLCMVRRGSDPTHPDLLAGIPLVVSLSGLSCACIALAYADPDLAIDVLGARVGIGSLLWTNVVAAVASVVAGVRHRDLDVLLDALPLLLCTPPAATALGALWPFALIGVCGYFAAKVLARLWDKADYRVARLERFSPIDALDAMPEGILCVEGDGRVRYMNDAMRTYLTDLGLPTDIGDFKGIWERMLALAEFADATPRGARLPLTDGRVLYLSREAIGNGSSDCIVAYDVTKQEFLDSRLERVGEELERSTAELKVSLQSVQEVAQNQARLCMRSRVHDVIGQRVSILHRHLEDGQVTDETIEALVPLLNDILVDLRSDDSDDPQASLDAVLSAFELVGVSYEVTGSLPVDVQVAGLFVRVVREASTNAVRHGQAKRVWVRMDQSPGSARLLVENDGLPPEGVREGGGIRGMQRLAGELGASLAVETSPRFAIRVVAPLAPRSFPVGGKSGNGS